MAQGSVKQRGQTWYWTVDVGTTPDGRRRQRKRGGFPTKRAAREALNLVLVALAEGRDGSDAGPRTLADFITSSWLPTKQTELREKTHRDYAYALGHYVLPRLGEIPLRKLTSAHVRDLYLTLLSEGGHGGKPLAPGTVSQVHRVLKTALADAVAWRLIAETPLAGVRPPASRAPTRVRYWTASELETFLTIAAEEMHYPLWWLLAHSGLRRGEALGLHWSELDFDAGALQVRWSLSETRKLTPPKTDAGRRRVPLDRETLAVLKARRRAQAEHRLALGWRDTEGLVFTDPEGTALRPGLVSQQFRKQVDRAGVPRIRLHDLRHTHASLLLAAGIHPKVVQERLGHSSITETFDTYSHLLPSMQDQAVAVMESLHLH